MFFLKFCVSNEIMSTEMLNIFQKCFGKSSLSRTQVFEWRKAFSAGREVIESLPLLMTRMSTKLKKQSLKIDVLASER